MNPARLMSTPCTITRRVPVDPPDTDEYGDDAMLATEVEALCWFEPIEGADADAGQSTDATWTFWFPPEVDVAAPDAVAIDSMSFEIVGNPAHAWHPVTRQVTHIRTQARRVA